jgi:hypothetical protein
LTKFQKKYRLRRYFFWNFVKPLLCEGRPEGELRTTAVQPPLVVQKATVGSLLHNEQGFAMLGDLKNVKPGTAAN